MALRDLALPMSVAALLCASCLGRTDDCPTDDQPDRIGDGIDQNCDSQDGVDDDRDGRASLASGGDDCDDVESEVHPEADDPFGDRIDQDCNGLDGSSVDPEGGPELVFVLEHAEVAGPDAGLDLDGHDTLLNDDRIGCGHRDGLGGIDNALSGLAEAAYPGLEWSAEADAGLLDQEIREGRLLVVARLLDVDDSRDDPRVAVLLHDAVDADGDPANNLGGEGRFVTGASEIELDVAALYDGLLEVQATSAGSLPFLVPLNGVVAPVTLQNVRFEASLGAGGLNPGFLGAAIATEEVRRAVRSVDPRLPSDLVLRILDAQADIDLVPPGPTERSCVDPTTDCSPGQECERGFCVEPENRCDALSVAYSISAVPAELVGVAH